MRLERKDYKEMTNYKEDEKAANEYANEPNSIDEFTLGDKLLMRAAFLAGCAHVRTSAEWKAMEKVIISARRGIWICECSCDSAYTERGMHEPNAHCGEMDDLKVELNELYRARKEGKEG